MVAKAATALAMATVGPVRNGGAAISTTSTTITFGSAEADARHRHGGGGHGGVGGVGSVGSGIDGNGGDGGAATATPALRRMRDAAGGPPSLAVRLRGSWRGRRRRGSQRPTTRASQRPARAVPRGLRVPARPPALGT